MPIRESLRMDQSPVLMLSPNHHLHTLYGLASNGGLCNVDRFIAC